MTATAGTPGMVPGACAAEVTLMRQACHRFGQRFAGSQDRPEDSLCLLADQDSRFGALARQFFPSPPGIRAGWSRTDKDHWCVP